MKFSIVLALLAAPLAMAADYNTVLADITVISASLKNLTADVNKAQSGFTNTKSLLQVQVDAVNLDGIIVQSQKDVAASPNFGFGSTQVALSLLNLQPQITDSLKNLTAKTTTFGELKPIVLASLYQLKQDTDKFGSLVTAKLDGFYPLIAPILINKIDQDFNSAIVAYGGKAT